MLISNIINDSFDLLSRQLRFYCWHYKRDLDQRQQQELVDILEEQYFERLANKIKSLLSSNIADCKQQIAKLLFDKCLEGDRRHQLIQLIESDLVDINVRLDNYGRTLLHRTAYTLDVELVKLLIEHGVNIKLRDYAGNTALHIAIQSYRNGALIYNSEPAVVQNLSKIIQLLLDADNRQQRIECFSNNEHSKLQSDLQSDGCSTQSHAHPSKLEESNDEPNLAKESHLIKNNPNSNLITNDKSISHNRDVTICRMLGSHCMCNADNSDQRQQQQQIKAIANNKISEQTLNGSNREGILPSSQETTMPLVNTKNAFGRTALHYCVLVVGEQHLDQTIKLLISYGADPDVIDTRLKTPLYCLVKRPGVAAVRQKCRAITHLINNGCDDLGLAITPETYFTENYIKNLETNISTMLQKPMDDNVEPIFVQNTFKRVPNLKHLARLQLIKMNDELNGKLCRQMSFKLPDHTPNSLNAYINRKVLDQTELF